MTLLTVFRQRLLLNNLKKTFVHQSTADEIFCSSKIQSINAIKDLAQSTFYALHRPLLTIGSEMLNNQSLEKQQQKIYEEEEEEESQQMANKFLNDIESRIRKQQFSDDFENIVENNKKIKDEQAQTQKIKKETKSKK
nr:8640_t:CDS:2 [Entrophospora candida]